MIEILNISLRGTWGVPTLQCIVVEDLTFLIWKHPIHILQMMCYFKTDIATILTSLFQFIRYIPRVNFRKVYYFTSVSCLICFQDFVFTICCLRCCFYASFLDLTVNIFQSDTLGSSYISEFRICHNLMSIQFILWTGFFDRMFYSAKWTMRYGWTFQKYDIK